MSMTCILHEWLFRSRKLRRFLQISIEKACYRRSWVTFISYPRSGDVIQLDMGKSDRHTDFCADPFLFRHEGRNWLFYETLTHQGKGIIGCFEEKSRGQWEQLGPVLELPCHISYPQVFAYRDHVYMIPETSDNGHGAVMLFEAEDFPYNWKPVKTLVARPMVDSTIVRRGEMWYLFGNTEGCAGEAQIWMSSELTGEWTLHPESRHVNQSLRLRRNAGRFIEDEDGLYRIAQDCNGAYGKRIFKVKVLELSPLHYREGTAELVVDGRRDGYQGCHTFNRIGSESDAVVAFDRSRKIRRGFWKTMRLLLEFGRGARRMWRWYSRSNIHIAEG